jgi:hypothetical protein
MHHRLSQVLRAGLASTVAQRDRMCRTIIFHNYRIIHRNIGGALLKFADWISAGLHHLADQTLHNGHRCPGIVYKPVLDFFPTNRKTGSGGGRQWADFELLCVAREIPVPLLPCEDLLPALQPDRIPVQSAPAIFGCGACALRKTGFQPRRLQRRRQLQPGVESDSCPSGSTMCCYGIRVPARMLSRRIFAIVARMLFTPTLSDAIRSLHQTYSGMTADS